MKILPLHVSLLVLMLYLFSVDSTWAGYLSQAIYWSIILISAVYLCCRSRHKSYPTSILLVITYILLLSSWSIFFFKYAISPDVIYEHQIVKDIVTLGHINSPGSYYYAARIYAEWPMLEIIASILSITTGIESLAILTYLWIIFKLSLMLCSLTLFKEVFKREFGGEITQEHIPEIVLYATLIFLASSSSIYFFSFSVKSLLSITYTIIYFILIYKRNAIVAAILSLAMGFSHNATTYIMVTATVLWVVIALVTRNNARERELIEKSLYRFLIPTALILIAIMLWKAQLSLHNIVRNLVYSFIFLDQPRIERGLSAAISPIKPLVYKVLGFLGEFILIAFFAVNIKKVVNKFTNSLTSKTPISLIMLFCLTYALGIITMVFVLGLGVDIVVRLTFYLNLAIAPYVSLMLLRLKNDYTRKAYKFALHMIFILFLVTGLYGIVPPSVYDKTVTWSMDDPRFFLCCGNSLWHIGDHIISHRPRYPIISIALGYYFLGGRGIPFISLCKLADYENTALVLLRRSIEKIPDYCSITLNLTAIYIESSIIYDSGEVFIILKY